MALLRIDLTQELNEENLHLEGGSRIVVNAIVTGKMHEWLLQKIVDIIRKKLCQF